MTAGYETPTPIQAEALSPALEGKDVIGLAQTGTGKTAAFALPIIHRLHQRMELGALVLAPTRELAQQIVGVFRELGRSTGSRVACIVGGMPMEDDWKALSSWPNVLVATPGRLIDHLEQKTVSLNEIEIFVIDEADRMHDMGFIPQIRRIIAHLPKERQTLMFTATMPADVERIVRQNMRDPLKIQVGPASRPVERAEQQLFLLDEEQKTSLLVDLLRQEDGRVLVFLKTKRGVDRLARRIQGRCARVTRLHGDREQAERDEAMGGFREGKYRVLIATDIAARGLDVADIEHVINYDFPRAPEDYVHRIGRTARLAASGKATSFVTPADRKAVRAVEQLIGSKINLVPLPGGRAAPGDGDGDGEGRSSREPRGRGRSRRGDGRVSAGPTRTAERHEAAGAPAPADGSGTKPRRRRGRGRGGKAPAAVAGTGAPQAQHTGASSDDLADARPAAPHPATQAPERHVAAGAPAPADESGTKPRRRRRGRGRGGKSTGATAGPGGAAAPPDRAAGADQADAAGRADTFDRPGRDETPDLDVPMREPTVIEWD
ncbi:MAG: DEAD/DEAH box helicase [Planctomycetes bacterium]|nr:DEAD/DEAH box helicase [Planctomycetota bacterium]